MVILNIKFNYFLHKLKHKKNLVHKKPKCSVTFWRVTQCPVTLFDLSSHTSKGVFHSHKAFEFWNLAHKFRLTTTMLHSTLQCFHLSRKRLKITGGVNCAPVIYGLPALRGYATMHVFRCIIWVSWDLIKITASKIPLKWNCRQKTMADTSSCRLFLFSAHQQRKANPCFHDGRQEGHKLCCFLTLLMLLCYVTHIKYTAN